MRFSIRILSTGLILLLTGGMAQASPTVHLNENFDNRPTAPLPSDNAPWHISGSSTETTYTVITDPTDAENQVLEVKRTGTIATISANTSPDVSLSADTVVTVSFDLYQPDKVGDADNTGFILIVDNIKAVNRGDAAYLSLSGSGSVGYKAYTGTTGTSTNTQQTADQDAWNHYKLVIRYDAQAGHFVYDLSVTPAGQSDPTINVQGINASTNVIAGDDLRVVLSPQGTTSLTLLDNLTVTSDAVPEPSSAAAVGAVGLMVGAAGRGWRSSQD